ncbi:ATP-grasp domain-containing protein [Photobacterium kagoshimensis]|uniref:ATP-grasp domain-containing protein n=1 Tax=Photobacterium kagoshimensis TaxID=2910242 RepID=UPI003D11FB98
MKKVLLFPNVGRRVELINCFRQFAQYHGIELTIIGTDITSDAPALHFCDQTYLLPKERNTELVVRYQQIIAQHHVDSVVCTIDPDLIFFSRYRSEISLESTVDLLLSSEDVIEASSDKKLTHALFETAGVNTPRLVTLPTHFPIFAKPVQGSGSFGAKLLTCQSELDSYLVEFGVYEPIFQQYIEGKEYTIDCFVTAGGYVAVSARERLKVRAGEVSVSKTVQHQQLALETKKLLLSRGFYGPVTLQAIIAGDGTIYFIEVNPRFGGGSVLSIEAGLQSPHYVLRGTELPSTIKANLKMLRYDMSVFVDENVK